jgi:zinc protease
VTWVNAGYFDEPDTDVGISHVLEHMYFKGTPTRGVGEIAKETKASGGYLNAHTIYDHTSYDTVLPSSGFVRGLEIQADAYANSLIDSAELARELEVIIQEAKRKLDTPSAVAVESLYALLHDHHRFRRWRIGEEKGLRALTRDRMQGFYRNYYRPRNTILVIVGDVTVSDAMSHVERLYGHLPDEPVNRDVGPDETTPPGFRFVESAGDVKQAQLALGWHTPGPHHQDTAALDLAGALLSDGRGSRLYRGVRERELASAVMAMNYTPARSRCVCHSRGRRSHPCGRGVAGDMGECDGPPSGAAIGLRDGTRAATVRGAMAAAPGDHGRTGRLPGGVGSHGWLGESRRLLR